MNPIRVDLIREGTTESSHLVAGVVVGSARDGRHAVPGDPGEGGRSFGNPALRAFWRSSMKPFQILPVMRAGTLERLGLGPEVLALACGSHHGMRRHVALVRSVLEAAGLGEEALACGPHRPFDPSAARRLEREGRSPGRMHNNCSGQHAALLALAAGRGWAVEGYHEPDHPLQRAIRRELSSWLGVESERLPWGIDGCGLPTPALSLRAMARAYADFANSQEVVVRAVATAMTAHPMLVSGPTALSANIMRATAGRVLAKEGTEGVFCLASPAAGWGAAFKVLDGAMRAVGPAVVHALSILDLLETEEVEALRSFARPAVRNTRDEEVTVLKVAEENHGDGEEKRSCSST